VIGCDVGSQGLKAIVVDEEGNVRGSASQSYPLIYPRPTWAEQDVRGWLRALEEAVPKALAEAGVDGREVVAFGLDGYVDGFVPINEVGEPLRLCFLWFDRRAVAECQLVATRITKEELFRLTGLNLDASHVAAKMLWFKRNEPTLFERTYKMLMPASYLVYELTGELAIDWSNASSTMLLDVSEKRWSERLLHAFEIDAEFLPPLKDATDVAGGLKPEWAKKLGLTPGIPVVVGSGDEHAACVGSGVVVRGWSATSAVRLSQSAAWCTGPSLTRPAWSKPTAMRIPPPGCLRIPALCQAPTCAGSATTSAPLRYRQQRHWGLMRTTC